MNVSSKAEMGMCESIVNVPTKSKIQFMENGVNIPLIQSGIINIEAVNPSIYDYNKLLAESIAQ
ncbi:MAG: hypothetical protein ACR2LL_13070 [Nitrosopumilus sp.]